MEKKIEKEEEGKNKVGRHMEGSWRGAYGHILLEIFIKFSMNKNKSKIGTWANEHIRESINKFNQEQ